MRSAYHENLVWFVVLCLVGGAISAFAFKQDALAMDARGADFPHQWFAWHPVRLQGGHPIPSVQEGGHVVWMKTIERYRFFDHWVYRKIGDTREMTQ
jgi:hypothetical protein